MDTITQLVQYLQGNQWFAVVSALIALFSAVAAVTPTPKDGSFWAKAYKVVDFLALNIGKAKDK